MVLKIRDSLEPLYLNVWSAATGDRISDIEDVIDVSSLSSEPKRLELEEVQMHSRPYYQGSNYFNWYHLWKPTYHECQWCQTEYFMPSVRNPLIEACKTAPTPACPLDESHTQAWTLSRCSSLENLYLETAWLEHSCSRSTIYFIVRLLIRA